MRDRVLFRILSGFRGQWVQSNCSPFALLKPTGAIFFFFFPMGAILHILPLPCYSWWAPSPTLTSFPFSCYFLFLVFFFCFFLFRYLFSFLFSAGAIFALPICLVITSECNFLLSLPLSCSTAPVFPRRKLLHMSGATVFMSDDLGFVAATQGMPFAHLSLEVEGDFHTLFCCDCKKWKDSSWENNTPRALHG